MLDFDTETTLFVCNKWDQVDEDEEEAVLEAIINKLRSDWPNVNPDQQLFKLSCKKEKKLIVKKSPSSRNYECLVEGIQNVMSKTLEAKLIRHVRWQKHFIEKMIERIGSKIKLSKEAISEREHRKKEAEERLNLLEKKLTTVKKSAEAKIDEKCNAIAKELVDHLNVVKEGLFIWKESELPEGTDMKCVAAKATELIRKKIHDEITEWRLSKSNAINAEIESIIASEFQIIEDDLKILQNCFGSLSRYTSNFMPLWSVMSFLTTFFTIGTGAQIVSSPIIFFGLMGVVVFLGELPFTFYYNHKNNEMTKKYNSNKLDCMKEWAEITLKKEVTASKIYSLMKPFMQNMKNNISYICETVVPNRISADKMCIDDLIKERRSDLDILKQYNPIQSCCEMIIGKIDITCMEFFPKCPLSFHYIQEAHIQNQIGSGSFSIVHSATISIENENIIAAVKTLKKPLDSLSSHQAVSEAIILRQFQHPNVLKLYGLSIEQDAEKKFLQIFLELCDDSLYNIVMVKRKPSPCGSFEKLTDCKNSWRFVFGIIEGVCSALEYIHNKGFVHRDLKLANIMVKGDCTVKLADFGISKKEENITGTSVGTPLYMAPEVLKGNVYGKEADIYSLGMVIYELWYYRPVFTYPRQSDATKFEMIVNTREELTDYVTSRNGRPNLAIAYRPPQKLKQIMKKCWHQTKEVRPTAKEVYDLLYKIKFS